MFPVQNILFHPQSLPVPGNSVQFSSQAGIEDLQHNVYPCYSMYQNFILFHWQVIMPKIICDIVGSFVSGLTFRQIYR